MVGTLGLVLRGSLCVPPRELLEPLKRGPLEGCLKKDYSCVAICGCVFIHRWAFLLDFVMSWACGGCMGWGG